VLEPYGESYAYFRPKPSIDDEPRYVLTDKGRDDLRRAEAEEKLFGPWPKVSETGLMRFVELTGSDGEAIFIAPQLYLGRGVPVSPSISTRPSLSMTASSRLTVSETTCVSWTACFPTSTSS
jgi:hypothetical protein